MKDLPGIEKAKIVNILKTGTPEYSSHLKERMQSFGEAISSSSMTPLLGDDLNSESELETEEDSVVSNLVYPQRPPSFISLIGHLKGKGFDKLDRKLWNYFSTGDYDNLTILVERLQTRTVIDYQIIGMWFKSLVMMHRDRNYQDCLMNVLFPALELCNNEKAENSTILRGRVLQRIAQVFLVAGNKTEAKIHFQQAEQELQFVGKCYETVNMPLQKSQSPFSYRTSET